MELKYVKQDYEASADDGSNRTFMELKSASIVPTSAKLVLF